MHIWGQPPSAVRRAKLDSDSQSRCHCEKSFTSTLSRRSGIVRGMDFVPARRQSVDPLRILESPHTRILLMKSSLPGLFCGRNAFALSALLALMALTLPAPAQTSLARISVDNLTNSDSDHKTEVEPDMFAWGSTIVTTFHVARRPGSIGWGSGDVGFSTSTDGGKTWHYGDLPGLTVNYKGGTYGAAADPSVAYDAKHGEWLISTLPLAGLSGSSGLIGDVAVSRSTTGLSWGNPIIIDKTHLDDKNWSVCDNTTTSPYYGNCYTEWDQAYGTGDVLMSVSSDGGKTWGPGLASSDHAGGLGGEPLVQPNGTVIVPFEGGGIDVFSSGNGGVSWGKSQAIATGRRVAYAAPLLEGLGLRADTPLIASNGAVIRTLGGETIHRSHLEARVARELCGLLRPFGAVVFTFDRPGRGELVVENLEQAQGRIALWVEANRDAIEVVKPLEQALRDGEDPIQGMAAGTVARMREAEQAVRASEWGGGCDCVRTEYPGRDLSILDLLPKGVSEGRFG